MYFGYRFGSIKSIKQVGLRDIPFMTIEEARELPRGKYFLLETTQCDCIPDGHMLRNDRTKQEFVTWKRLGVDKYLVIEEEEEQE